MYMCADRARLFSCVLEDIEDRKHAILIPRTPESLLHKTPRSTFILCMVTEVNALHVCFDAKHIA